MASIMKRGNTYSVRYNYKDHAGKPCKGWETFKTKAEAQERKITVEKELLLWVLTHHLQYFRISIRTCSIILNSYLHKIQIHRLTQSVRKW